MKYNVDVSKVVKKITDSSDKALLYCWEYLADKLKEQIQEDSYDLGTYANSITYRTLKKWVVVVGSNIEYAPVLEYGRKPGKFPNLDALVGWTARKGMITGGATKTYDNLYYKDKGVVFLIARAIATRGTKGKHTFKNVYNAEKQNIINLYRELLAKWV